ncbi:MAG: hypothetical protein P8J50_16770 [Acidimicrobiales bacterium]|jgi:hypothetical protein|nr:hypothetical protein [Acidimicrobiales bacterium]
MAGSVDWLADAPDTDRNIRVFGSEHPMREVTRTVAFGGEWNEETRDFVAGIFDSMAPEPHV